MSHPEVGESGNPWGGYSEADLKDSAQVSTRLDRISWGSRFVRRVLDQFGSRKFSDTAWRTSFEVGLLSVVSGGNVVLTVIASASALIAVASSMVEDSHHNEQPF